MRRVLQQLLREARGKVVVLLHRTKNNALAESSHHEQPSYRWRVVTEENRAMARTRLRASQAPSQVLLDTKSCEEVSISTLKLGSLLTQQQLHRESVLVAALTMRLSIRPGSSCTSD